MVFLLQFWKILLNVKFRSFYIVFLIILLFTPTIFSQSFYFGRNKVQYKNFNWQLMRTEHFDIYYYPEMEELAKIGARFAEDGFEKMKRKCNHDVQRRIPMIFYNSKIHFQQTNILPFFIPEGVEGFIEYLKGRVSVPFNGSLNQFKTTITHELVHALTNNKINRVQKDHRITKKSEPPFWFNEGIADYWAGEWDSYAEMVLRDMVINNNFVSLENINMLTGSYLAYKEGQSLLEYISLRFGEEKIRLLMENFWKYDRFTQVVENTINYDYKQLGKDWEYYLKKKYYPLLDSSDLPTYHTVQLTKKGFNRMPVYYKNGEKESFIFITNRSGYTNICLKPIDTKETDVEVLLKGERSNEFEYFHLFEKNLSISKKNILTFVVKSGGRDVLYLMDLTNREVIEKFEYDDLITISGPSWSENGMYIVFAGVDKSGKKDIFYINTMDGEKFRVTNDFYEDKDPVWIEDGRYIVFGSDRGDNGYTGSFNLFCHDIQSGKTEYVTSNNFNDYAPVVNRKHNIIAYISERDEVANIWGIKFKIEGTGISVSEPVRFTNYITAAVDPSWTENNGLLFSSFENFSYNIQKIPDVLSNLDFNSLKYNSLQEYTFKGGPKLIQEYEVDPSQKYKRKYSLDLAQGQVIQDPLYGTSGGAQIALSDILGDDKYYFLLYNNAQSKSDFFSSFNYAITRVFLAKRLNFAYGLYHFSGHRIYSINFNDYYWERKYGASFSLSYPLSKFKRLAADIYFNRSDRDYLTYRRKAMLFSYFLSYIKDNSIWGMTGPVDGTRYNVTVGYTKDITYNNVKYWTLLLDIRNYFRLTNRITLASRLMTLYNEGKEAQRYYFGGSWDLRGYKRFSLAGEKIWLSSTELRFPFIDLLGISFPIIRLVFRDVRGALFLDFGNSWNKKYDDTLGSYGFGVRLNIFGVLVLRYDTGRKFINKFELVRGGKFKQFFFGWDF